MACPTYNQHPQAHLRALLTAINLRQPDGLHQRMEVAAMGCLDAPDLIPTGSTGPTTYAPAANVTHR